MWGCKFVQEDSIYSVQGETDATINLTVDDYSLCFTIDTGSPVTLIPKDIYKNYWQGKRLFPTNLRLKSFCGKSIEIIDQRNVFVKEANQYLRLIVVNENIQRKKRFSQLENKALSITFGVEKFRQYLLGQKFVLVTDNRPLIHIFSPHKPIPICASSRIKRWSLKLAAFNYTVEFRKTSDNSNVDALSRLPLESSVRESLDEDQVLLLRKSNEVPFSFMEVANETPQDKILSIILRNVREGNWKFTRVPRENPLAPHYKINEELSLEFGCLQWRERVQLSGKRTPLPKEHFGSVIRCCQGGSSTVLGVVREVNCLLHDGIKSLGPKKNPINKAQDIPSASLAQTVKRGGKIGGGNDAVRNKGRRSELVSAKDISGVLPCNTSLKAKYCFQGSAISRCSVSSIRSDGEGRIASVKDDFLHYATNPESELEDTDSDCTIVYNYEESSGEDEEVPPPLKTPRSDYIWSDNSNYDPIIFSFDRSNSGLQVDTLLHFNDNKTQIPGDKLHKLKSVVDHMKSAYKNAFKPFQDVCIDESLVLFKGRLGFKQYIPSKRKRFGIKLFVLCDVETKYILDFIVYVGKGTEIEDSDMGVSSSVITTLLQPYMNKGHSLWVDNWYSSPTLFNFLHQRQTNVCGTVRKNRKEMPRFGKKLKIGETEAKHTQNLLALKYKDKREVFMLSTMHKNEFANTNKRDKVTNLPIQKPSAVIDYNQKMGTVDQTDMLLSSIGCLRKSLKWYKKLFFHFIDTSLLNAYSLYLVNTGKRPSLAEFHINLIGQIIEKYHEARVQVHRGRPSTSEDIPLRLIERHFPSLVPPTEKKKNPTRYCHVCGANKKRKESRYMCKDCDVALCVVPCFETFHTIKNFYTLLKLLI
ncbi:hypothetical protein LAZ67_17003232 [Cordylochernes scorpioides]|uniref:PiggyBac transposable element-derived protein 4 n=1 Tax=Cordylochernes scorpioides TaxID=51811 RepID=A0ABY6LIA1_9ARAC|nr:hypothetical protein LAZ67_17003232 [Cordylochernes scorpioides]